MFCHLEWNLFTSDKVDRAVSDTNKAAKLAIILETLGK